MDSINATRLRADLYKILDRVIESGQSVEIVRKGRRLRIAPAPAKARPSLEKLLEPHPGAIKGEADDLIRIDLSKEWKPFI